MFIKIKYMPNEKMDAQEEKVVKEIVDMFVGVKDVWQKDDGMRDVEIHWKEKKKIDNPQEKGAKAMAEQLMPGIDGQEFKIKLDDRAFDIAREEAFLGGGVGNNRMIVDEVGQFPINHAAGFDMWHEKKKPKFAIDENGIKLKDKERMEREAGKMNLDQMRKHLKEQIFVDANAGELQVEAPQFNAGERAEIEMNNHILFNDEPAWKELPRQKLGIMVDYEKKMLIMRDLNNINISEVSLEILTFAEAIGSCLNALFPDIFEIQID